MATDIGMTNLSPHVRHRVASLAAALYRQEIDYRSFLSALPSIDDRQDDAVAELLDLIEHEPARGRVLGLSAHEHEAYLADIQRRIAELAADGRECDPAT
jgi:hypothetical protein